MSKALLILGGIAAYLILTKKKVGEKVMTPEETIAAIDKWFETNPGEDLPAWLRAKGIELGVLIE